MPSDGSMAADGAAPAAEARIIGVLNGGINGVPAFLRAALRAPPPVWTRGLLLPGLPCAPAVPMPDGFELELTKADGYVMPKVLIPFDPPLEKAGEVRKVAVAMHFAAFNGLGWQYKLANGFYTGAARQAWHHMPPRVKSGLVGAFAVVCAAVMRVMLLR